MNALIQDLLEYSRAGAGQEDIDERRREYRDAERGRESEGDDG